MNTYVAIAYRSGYTNGGHYIVTAGANRDTVIAEAEEEAEGRGQKYGIQVLEFPSGKQITYFPSYEREPRPFLNPRIMAAENVGLLIMVAAEGLMAKAPALPDWLKELCKRQIREAEIMCVGENRAEHGG